MVFLNVFWSTAGLAAAEVTDAAAMVAVNDGGVVAVWIQSPSMRIPAIWRDFPNFRYWPLAACHKIVFLVD